MRLDVSLSRLDRPDDPKQFGIVILDEAEELVDEDAALDRLVIALPERPALVRERIDVILVEHPTI